MSAPSLEPFGPDIWTVEGPAVSVFGFRYPTRMAVIRLADASLFVWSPIGWREELRGLVDAAGPVRFIVAPNTLHHLSLKDWQAAYPKALLYAAPGLREKRKDLAFDGALEDACAPGWAGQIEQAIVRGNLITTEVVFFHRASGTVLFTDLIQNFLPGWFTGWRAIVARWDRLTGHEAQVPQKFRAAFVNRAAARAALERVLAWPAQRVLMAHGSPIREDGQAFIRRAFGWLCG